MARVLVLEDDPAITELVRLYLTHAGHEVELGADGYLTKPFSPSFLVTKVHEVVGG